MPAVCKSSAADVQLTLGEMNSARPKRGQLAATIPQTEMILTHIFGFTAQGFGR